MSEFARKLLEHPSLGRMVAHHRRIDGRAASYAEPRVPLDPRMVAALQSLGIERLYTHQARALDAARGGRDTLLVTPTASGKTLPFATTVLESVLEDPQAKALFIYPTKALAQDQVTNLREFAGALGALAQPRFEIYDGDTPAVLRRRIKSDPPQALITNPDMLHFGILSRHQEWEKLLSNLRWIVLDELHVYRGLFGAHVHHILLRLGRLCEHYGSRPRFIAASATVGNPAEFSRALVGRDFEVIDSSGAPRSPREVLFINPVAVSPYTAATRVLACAVESGLRTIAFTKSRRVTELLQTWLVRQDPTLEHRIAAYRGGYLPQERRHIEARLFRGDLCAVISTSALELGIDVGGLDLCVLVGYPGSLISSWQRIGRVGRAGREGLVVLIALPDALDQYVVRHPEIFFDGTFERAVLDPWNPQVAGRHLVCAASEEAVRDDELARWGPPARRVTDALVADGRLVQDEAGTRWFSFRRRPHRDVHLRSAGQPFVIVDRRDEKLLGTIGGNRVYHECHPGAIYLHGGRSYCIVELDVERRRVVAENVRADYYTVVLGEKETEILERLEFDRLGPFPIGMGRLKVTVRIRGYQKKRLFDGEPISTHDLDIPPLIFETVGFWIELAPEMPTAYAERDLHFMGAIHATEHAMIGLFPLLAIADVGDVGGISYTGHPQLGGPAIFVYDGVPGGAGLSEQGFRDLPSLLERTLAHVSACPCDEGCPACIQSPRCGNGNKPLDKAGSCLTLELLLGKSSLASLGVAPPLRDPEAPLPPWPVATPAVRDDRRHGIRRAGNVEPAEAPVESVGPAVAPSPAPPAGERVLIFDLETQRSAADVGGWGNVDRMGLALAVIYDVGRGVFRTYYESDVERLLLDLVMADRVVGFNIDRFDLGVLSAYTEWELKRIRTLDLLAEICEQLGFRLSLNHLSETNLGESKAGEGLQSLQWWKEGRIDLIEQYCRQDVEVTRKLYDLGRRQGYLLYRDHSQRRVRVPVRW